MKYYKHLNSVQRRIIGQLYKNGYSMRRIARLLEVAPSTISREIQRNRCGFGYMSNTAEQKARSRKSKANRRPLKVTPEVWDLIVSLIIEGLSPEQIALTIHCHFPRLSLSPETIYYYIRLDRKYTGELYLSLRRKGKAYRKYNPRDKIPGRVDIDERPLSVEQKRYYGDWEVDLMEVRRHRSYMLVAVERKSMTMKITLLKTKTAAEVTESLIDLLRPFKVRTLTFDNGSEFAYHKEISKTLNTKVYYCKPHHPWEKGLVENFIGLLRQYYPKGYKGRKRLPEAELIEEKLNQRPRKTLGFIAPIKLDSKIRRAA